MAINLLFLNSINYCATCFKLVKIKIKELDVCIASLNDLEVEKMLINIVEEHERVME